MFMNLAKKMLIIASTTINRGASLCTFDQDFQELQEFGLRLFR
jgi:predicted nucleic acid-binding protein